MNGGEPYLRPLLGTPLPQHSADDLAVASRERVLEEQAYLRARGTTRLAKSELPVVRLPVLPDNFEQKIAALDSMILQRGIAIDKERLLSLGRERFQQLL